MRNCELTLEYFYLHLIVAQLSRTSFRCGSLCSTARMRVACNSSELRAILSMVPNLALFSIFQHFLYFPYTQRRVSSHMLRGFLAHIIVKVFEASRRQKPVNILSGIFQNMASAFGVQG